MSRTFTDRASKTVTQVVIYPDSVSNAIQVAVNGQLAYSISKTGVRTDFVFDSLGRQISALQGGPGASRTVGNFTVYNQLGQVESTMDATSNVTRYVYDSLGRRTQVIDALSNTTFTAYNDEGQVLATWGATYPVAYEFDNAGRMTAMYTYRGTNSLSSYSEINNLKSQMDRTRWLYDEATGLLTNKQYSDNQGPCYTYTPDGKLATRTWARGVVTTYCYDSLGQMTNISYSDGTPGATFTFNRLGQQATITDGAGTRTFTYNDALQLQSEICNQQSEIMHQYDALGRPAGFDAGSSHSVRYGFDLLGRFSTVSNNVGGALRAATYSHLPGADLVQGYTSDSGVSLMRAYEPNRNLITQSLSTSGTNVVSQFDYSNDAIGRRIKRIDYSSVTNDFGYNNRSELTEAFMGTNIHGYCYDPIGNRISATNNSVTWSYTANSLNQYSQMTSNDAPITPEYDADGNLSIYGALACSWDAENRLVQVSNATVNARYKYDYMSRRCQKIAAGVTNDFQYDGWNLVSEISNDGSQAITNRYVWGTDLSGSLQGAGGIGGLLSVTRNGETYYPLCDANGNITDYIDASGAVVAHREFDAYGNTVAAWGALVHELHFWFSSKYLDEETGFYYYGHRYFMPEIGRWCSRDPIQETLLYIARANRTAVENNAALRFANLFLVMSKKSVLRDVYLFCRNNPVCMMDGFGFSYIGPTWCVSIGSYDEWEPTGEAQHSDWVQLRVDVLPWLPEVTGFFDYYYMAWWQQQRKVHVEETLCRSLCGESTIERDSVPTGETKTHWWTTWIITPTGVDPNGPCDDSRFCML
ncbi:MAG: RHS repeat-associated core domain-containing protein [bacterium]